MTDREINMFAAAAVEADYAAARNTVLDAVPERK